MPKIETFLPDAPMADVEAALRRDGAVMRFCARARR